MPVDRLQGALQPDRCGRRVGDQRAWDTDWCQ